MKKRAGLTPEWKSFALVTYRGGAEVALCFPGHIKVTTTHTPLEWLRGTRFRIALDGVLPALALERTPL